MTSVLTDLNAHVEQVMATLESDAVRRELATGLHNDAQGAQPDPELKALAGTSIDLLHRIEQKLESGYLVLADHFLGYVHAKCLVGVVNLHVADTWRNTDRWTSKRSPPRHQRAATG
ncbi:uncharacterized protein M421DRAFT_553 [Didymella exigua CBS 183.55]|uniref:Uncharacterized protein n=1 Tax=Didymella exigua CBS 183.55 TaxID=1150837 RepID=A0A6A5S4Q0_9PLEO|nr:uncharacterized protein M421DRAFT_553 [Didymella exigua CBS 183.55]KAF1934434.1 hypothetical protein M421DRAFT_553 [Didymella exigua CBS 183.55]